MTERPREAGGETWESGLVGEAGGLEMVTEQGKELPHSRERSCRKSENW